MQLASDHSTRVGSGMCGTPRSGSDISGLVYPVCDVQGAACKRASSQGCARDVHFACVEHAAIKAGGCAVRMLYSRAAQIRAQPQAEMLGQDSATQHGTGCGVQCTEREGGAGATGAGCREQYALQTRPPQHFIFVGQSRAVVVDSAPR